MEIIHFGCVREESEFLFWIGDKDITVKKKGFDGNVVDQKSFQYRRMGNLLIGGINNRKGKCIPKRIVVIQMTIRKENQKNKQK